MCLLCKLFQNGNEWNIPLGGNEFLTRRKTNIFVRGLVRKPLKKWPSQKNDRCSEESSHNSKLSCRARLSISMRNENIFIWCSFDVDSYLFQFYVNWPEAIVRSFEACRKNGAVDPFWSIRKYYYYTCLVSTLIAHGSCVKRLILTEIWYTISWRETVVEWWRSLRCKCS